MKFLKITIVAKDDFRWKVPEKFPTLVQEDLGKVFFFFKITFCPRSHEDILQNNL